jgi:hypothetical protein
VEGATLLNMTETTVITSTPEEPEGSVLAEAAVASAALGGAAVAKADEANDAAQMAQWSAEGAEVAASIALSEVAGKVDEARAREIAREELATLIAEAAATREPEATAVTEVTVAPEVLPPSVARANNADANGETKDTRTSFAKWWEG